MLTAEPGAARAAMGELDDGWTLARRKLPGSRAGQLPGAAHASPRPSPGCRQVGTSLPPMGFDSCTGTWQGAAKWRQRLQCGDPSMSTKAERGTKRTCQNSECGSRFYDLNRDPITCPVCGTAYALAAAPAGLAAAAPAAADRAARKPMKKPTYAVESAKPEDAPEAETEDALVVDGEDEA